jgi:hypothetical protein
MSSARIFISYRRADSAGWAGRLHGDLRERFGADRVFRDVAIAPGVDFREHIEGVMDGCEVLLAVIGPRWATVTGPDGRPRLDAPDDLVRLEIERALGRPDVHVIPVLVEGAAIPAADDLPAGLRPLSRRNAVEITDVRWEYDVDRLCDCLHGVLGESMVSAAVPRPGDPTSPVAPAPALRPQARSMGTALVAGATLAGILGAALTGSIADARPKGDIDGALSAWSAQWLVELGARLGPYAAQRAIVWTLVAAAVLGAAAIVRRRAGGGGASPRAVLAGLCAGAMAGLAEARTHATLRYVTEWQHQELRYGISVAVGAAVVGAVVARAVGAGSAAVAALAAAGGGFLAGLASAGMSPSALALAVQAALVVGVAAAVVLAPGAYRATTDPATLPRGAAAPLH